MLVIAVLVFSASTARAASITVYTDITGANTTIDEDHWFVWSFNLVSGATVEDVLGSFVIKRGTNTSEDITFSLFEGDQGGVTDVNDFTTGALTSFSIAAANVATQYQTRLFPLNPDPDLDDSVPTYSLVLWSEAGPQGAFQFFFKGQGQELIVNPCDIIEGDDVVCSEDPPPLIDETVPEPSTILLTLSGIAVLAIRRWRA
jgi:hypothetical protein